jgi:hypothetical protein
VALQPTPPSDRTRDGERTARKRAATMCQVGRFVFKVADLGAVDETPVIYWWDEAFRKAYREAPKLGEVAPARATQGLYNNTRFIRESHEVGLATIRRVPDSRGLIRWVPLTNGMDGAAWFEPLREVASWAAHGIDPKTYMATVGRRQPPPPLPRRQRRRHLRHPRHRLHRTRVPPRTLRRVPPPGPLRLALTPRPGRRPPSTAPRRPARPVRGPRTPRAADRPPELRPRRRPRPLRRRSGEGILDPATADLDPRPAGRPPLPRHHPRGRRPADGLRPPRGRAPARRLGRTRRRHRPASATCATYLARHFFNDVHRKMYENRPIHWPLSSGKHLRRLGQHPPLGRHTLRVLLADHLNPTLARLEGALADLDGARFGADSQGRPRGRAPPRHPGRSPRRAAPVHRRRLAVRREGPAAPDGQVSPPARSTRATPPTSTTA